MATVAERRALLGELERLGLSDLGKLWRSAELSDDFRALMLDAFPELVLQYGSMAADLAAVWYDEAAPALPYRAFVADPPPAARFGESASWALNKASGSDALALLGGTLQRGMWDMSRETSLANVAAEPGAKWARHASANACEFCRMLATRGAVYGSEASAGIVGGRGKAVATGPRKRGGQGKGVRTRGTQSLGDKYHDNCHCVAVEVRPGGTYKPPPYVERWEREYVAASKVASGTKGILREMRNQHTP